MLTWSIVHACKYVDMHSSTPYPNSKHQLLKTYYISLPPVVAHFPNHKLSWCPHVTLHSVPVSRHMSVWNRWKGLGLSAGELTLVCRDVCMGRWGRSDQRSWRRMAAQSECAVLILALAFPAMWQAKPAVLVTCWHKNKSQSQEF